MTYCVGLTGDIASGKTTVANLFSRLGIDIISADKIAKELTQKNQPAYEKILAHYGIKLLHEDGSINRKMLRTIIFSNPEERIWLEELLHPLIKEELKKAANSCKTPYCIIELPLLITKQTYPYLNKILLIKSLVPLQIARVMQRDQCTEEEAKAILKTQPHLSQRLEHADEVLINDRNTEELEKKVKALHHQYLHEAAEK
jgi:dephospho-CoA kinase